MTTRPPSLHFEPDRSLLIEADREPVVLRISPRTMAARHWPKGHPGLMQLERAIDDVENAIEQAGLVHADRGMLVANVTRRDLLPAGFGSSGDVSRDEVERALSDLVASAGSPPMAGGPRLHAEAAAALLLLREVMHHLGFQSLRMAA